MSECLMCRVQISKKFYLKSFIQGDWYLPQYICGFCQMYFQKISINENICSNCFGVRYSKFCKNCEYWQNEQGTKISHSSMFSYNEAMADYFKQYKMYGDYLLKNLFFEDLYYEFKKNKFDVYAYIPTSKSHLRHRKFDPVLGMFQDVCELTPLLINVSDSNDNQSKKGRVQRMEAECPFIVNRKVRIKENTNMLLIDDIYTTGRTINFGIQAILDVYPNINLKTFSLVRV